MILAIDPGKDKCGIALLLDTGELKEKKIVPPSEVFALVEKYRPQTILLGDGTYSKTFSGLKNVILVKEKNSTLEARERYFKDHPPRGIMRWLPAGLRFPPVQIDDYAAWVLAQRYLEGIK